MDQLRHVGAVDAYIAVKGIWPNASMNLLYALVGAIEDQDWKDVKRTRKLDLLLTLEARGSHNPHAPRRSSI